MKDIPKYIVVLYFCNGKVLSKHEKNKLVKICEGFSRIRITVMTSMRSSICYLKNMYFHYLTVNGLD